MKMKLLDYTLMSLLAGAGTAAHAQEYIELPTHSDGVPAAEQDDDRPEAIVFTVRSQGDTKPETVGTDADSGSVALQPDRRVTVSAEHLHSDWRHRLRPGQAIAVGRWSIDLPGGGIIWASEDPQLGQPELSVSAPSLVAFDGQRIVEPVRFYAYSNYSAFVQDAEVQVFAASDADLVHPLARIALPVASVTEAHWDGRLPEGFAARAGDELVYIVRASNAQGDIDETFPRRLQLVTPEQAARGHSLAQSGAERAAGMSLSAEQAELRNQLAETFGQSNLRQQNIPVHGSRVRIQGRDIPRGMAVTINGRNHPVDLEGKLVAEYLVPVGQHRFDVGFGSHSEQSQQHSHALEVDVTGRYLFAVAMADFTLSGSKVGGSMQPDAAGLQDKDLVTDGRLAFYAKGKFKGKYLVTAQADTREREVSQLFKGFFDADPQDIFRRLDPDQYYPTYGDDSTTWRDVDTMGRLYVRVDWDQNQALWGNYHTGLTGTEFAQYSRSLYGAALRWRSRSANAWGEASTSARAFASKAQTAPGHTQLLGTGGSLYYLRHTDVLPGSEKIVLEVRDSTTGRVERRVDLLRGADYEIDEMQGRILLTRPLAQVTRENIPTLTRDMPLDGFAQMLLVDYEYVPTGFNPDESTVGLRGKHWFGDYLALGATFVDENRAGQDYRLMGADFTLQAGRGTYFKAEHSQSQSTSAPVFFSDNGGLSFARLTPMAGEREGKASAAEARVNLKELGWTDLDWSAGAWWRNVDAGYSVARFDIGADVREYGAEVLGQLAPHINLYARYSRAERGDAALTQAQVTGEWRISDASSLSAELRRVEETYASLGQAAGLLAAVKYLHRLSSGTELYGIGQYTVDDDDGRYASNNALTLGGRHVFGNLSSAGAELTYGDRGHAAQVNAEYRLSQMHSIYGAYTYSTDRSDYDALFNPRLNTGWTLGQRWRLNNQVNLFNESQFLKTPRESGLAHTFGMDFYPVVGWNMGFTLQEASLDGAIGHVDRRAISLNGGHTSNATYWQSKLEWRRDSGAEQRRQWVTTHMLTHKFNESWRIAARLNHSDTEDLLMASAGARFTEGNLGFAWRPFDSTRWALLGRYTYLYDVSALSQEGSNMAWYDQRSQVLSLEGIYHPSHNWEFAAKLARREGEVRYGRMQGQWADSTANFAAVQARYGITTEWGALAEYRWLNVNQGGTRQGALIAVDRDIGRNFRIGAGYNFTDFSNNLTQQDYNHKGWFINVNGRY